MNPSSSETSELRHSVADSLARHDVNQPFAAGAPRFADAELQRLSENEGSLSAWQLLVDRDGPAGLQRVSGHFAVAVRSRDGAWLLAVDRFATHGICWREADGQLEFGHRADDLARRQGSLEGQIDAQAIFDYLFHHVIPSPRTVFHGIHRLPAGHALWWTGAQSRPHAYWQPRFEPVGQPNFESLKGEFRALLRQAVQRNLPGGGAPHCFLSGGTDSSTVTGMAREVTGQAPHSFSIGFDAEGYDEMAYARIAAKAYACNHHEYYVTPDDLVRSIPQVAGHYDQPFGNSSAVPAFYCARMAKLAGARNILAGDGGDELFGGNTRYAREGVLGWWDHMPQQLLGPVMDNALTRSLPLIRKASSYVKQASVPMPDRMQTHNLLYEVGIPLLLTPAFLAQVQIDAPRLSQRGVWADIPAASLLNRMLAFDWRYTLAENDLPKVVGTTQLAGLPVGFPLLDDDLLDFSLRLPDRYKLRGFKLRWFFKEALRGFLPDEIITKKKHGFGLPFGPWALRHEGLNLLASDSVRALVGRGIVQPEFATGLMTELLPKHPGYYGELVWILMMLEQWLRQHAPDYRLS